MSAAPQKQFEVERLALIRALVPAAEYRLDGLVLYAVDDMGEIVPVLTFSGLARDEEKQFFAAAPLFVRLLLRLHDRAVPEIKRLRALLDGDAPQEAPDKGQSDPWDEMRRERAPGRAARPDPKDYAAQAAMCCGQPGFLAFLRDRHGLEAPLTAERAAQKVRSLCGVSSRAEFNTDGKAADAWRALYGAFQTWKRVGR